MSPWATDDAFNEVQQNRGNIRGYNLPVTYDLKSPLTPTIDELRQRGWGKPGSELGLPIPVPLWYLTGKSFDQRVPLWYLTGKAFEQAVPILYLTGESFDRTGPTFEADQEVLSKFYDQSTLGRQD